VLNLAPELGYDYIEGIKDEHVEQGGAGVSVITLK